MSTNIPNTLLFPAILRPYSFTLGNHLTSVFTQNAFSRSKIQGYFNKPCDSSKVIQENISAVLLEVLFVLKIVSEFLSSTHQNLTYATLSN